MFSLCRVIILAIAAVLAGGPAHAAGDEICVICDGPPTTYVCKPTASAEHKVFLNNRRLTQLACIKNLAKAFGHQSCKARAPQNQACTGQFVQVDLSRMAQQYAERLPRRLQPGSGQQSAPFRKPKPNNPNAPPKTVVELAKRTVDTSKQQLQQAGKAVQNAGKAVETAGKAVGDTAKQTWRCLSTLFQDC